MAFSNNYVVCIFNIHYDEANAVSCSFFGVIDIGLLEMLSHGGITEDTNAMSNNEKSGSNSLINEV